MEFQGAGDVVEFQPEDSCDIGRFQGEYIIDEVINVNALSGTKVPNTITL